MNNSILIPTEFKDVIDARSQAWLNFDLATQTASELQQLSGRIPAGSLPEPLANFTQAGEPPTEARIAVDEMNKALAGIEQSNNQISEYQNQIQSIRSHAMMMYIIMGTIGVILAILAFSIISGVIFSQMQ